MFKKLVTSAMFAGVGAGLIAALLQILLLVPIILEAEEYESGEKIHYAVPMETAAAEMAEPDMAEGAGAGEESAALSRNFLTTLWTIGNSFGYALILVAAFAVASKNGINISARSGILWGAAGFVALHLAPGMGLPAELPGSAAAELADRKIWWAATAVATAIGLGLLAFGKSWVYWGAAIILLMIPHLIGAPKVEEFGGVVPPELAAEFASRSLAVGAIVWVVLGTLAGYLWSRDQSNIPA